MSGEILFKGTPLTSERVWRLRGRELVLVPQSVTYLDPLMKTGQQLTKGRRIRKFWKNAKISCVPVDWSLEVMDKYPFQLSGGMARRVLISTAAMEERGVSHCRRAHAGSLIRKRPWGSWVISGRWQSGEPACSSSPMIWSWRFGRRTG
ncbi:MAG: ATP-binding cassette domain-containing protein [Clostridium sp.]